MAKHRHKRAHLVINVSGRYEEGPSKGALREWREGDIALFPPGHAHASYFHGKSVLGVLKLSRASLAEIGIDELHAVRSAKASPELLERFMQLAESMQTAPSVDTSMSLRAYALVDEALESVIARSKAAWLSEVVRRIRTALVDPPSVAQLAVDVAMTPSHVSAAFRRQMGVSIRQYTRRMRVLEAARLLAATSATVTEAAHAVGFCDAAHLSRCIKSYSRITPRQLRSAPVTHMVLR